MSIFHEGVPDGTHPIQPLEKDDKGVVRFKANKIVQHLLDNGAIDMNALARLEFSQEDREQFAQLIGYSLDGYSSLSYVTDISFSTAQRMYEQGETEVEARIASLEETLKQAQDGVRAAAVALFRIHPDDLIKIAREALSDE